LIDIRAKRSEAKPVLAKCHVIQFIVFKIKVNCKHFSTLHSFPIMLNHLFVYGTLRRANDGSLHPYLRGDGEFLAKATVPGSLYDLGSYPGWVRDFDHSQVEVLGEVYRLLHPQHTLLLLDAYEECTPCHPQPHEYERCTESVHLTDGTDLEVWIYRYCLHTDNVKRIESGDYGPMLPASHSSYPF